jgi:hypothetical protein
MQLLLVTAHSLTSKGYWVKYCRRCFSHEIKVAAAHLLVRRFQGDIIVGWLAGYITETVCREISAEDQ